MAGLSLKFALASLLLVGTSAQAQPPLREVPEVRNGLVYVGIAYEISERCDDLSARLLRGLGYLQSLKWTARDMGYSSDEIDTFVNSDEDRKYLESLARDLLERLGAVEDDPQSFCAVGRAEMAKGTRVGWLLR